MIRTLLLTAVMVGALSTYSSPLVEPIPESLTIPSTANPPISQPSTPAPPVTSEPMPITSELAQIPTQSTPATISADPSGSLQTVTLAPKPGMSTGLDTVTLADATGTTAVVVDVWPSLTFALSPGSSAGAQKTSDTWTTITTMTAAGKTGKRAPTTGTASSGADNGVVVVAVALEVVVGCGLFVAALR